ncbi:glycan-binding surface protein [Chitinophaga cymbidii]|uniref:Surface glycan-binding protein B xyloglucan binding domain-containing protein n=1 Tax=Chitinophaga cymbidii TaxID=1096750 RepID=A0A512RG98_9BACT|nr:glycan-binding surface protein [Chitinophaga cymbidii]GEP94715.1 hypothetical protein CCY01nite_09750 [Chitinophaga cymbidii]
MTRYHFTAAKRSRLLLLCLIACGLFLINACKKDNGVGGPPMITAVSLLDAESRDSTFVKALPGTLVLIRGENLGGIVKVYFNDMESYFNQTYNTTTSLIMTIPDNAPTEATNPDVPNKIRIVTSHGEATYDFVVDIPPPSILAISNENALPGDTLFIFGSSLWLIEKVIFPGGREITELMGDADGSWLGMVMPDLGTDTGRIVIIAGYGTTMSDGPLNDHQSGDVISNLTDNGEPGENPVFNWAWWGANRTSDPALFPGTRGAYLQNVFGGVGANDGGWWIGNRSGNFNDVPMFTAAIMTQQASNYALKFEINTKEPWTAGVNVLRFGESYAYRFKPWETAPNQEFHTENRWRTVTIPLSEFKTMADNVEGTGAGAMVMGDLLKPGGVVAFGYRFVTEDAPVEVFNAAFDNFRIIKIR